MPMLRITFSGLCTFIFDRPLRESPRPSEVTVLLQRLTQARELKNRMSARTEILDQHFPLLSFFLTDYDGKASSRFADVHCLPDANGRMTKGACLLNGEDLTILLDGRRLERNSLELSNEPPREAASSNLSKRERDSLWWMATLGDVFQGNTEINPRILNTPPGSNQPILARIQVSEGQLRTLELTDFPCTVVPPVPGFRRRVAMSFELAVPFSSTVTFKSVINRNGRTSEGELVFRPDGGNDLLINIMNMEINRFVGLDPANGPRAEADFGVYNELLANPIQGDIPFLRQASTGDPSSAPHSSCVPGGI